ncbi:hypothetical protein LCGC14_1083870 [marine sediment metagenome]|uniref:DNA methylase N-4/N-6 domain-containing protein n=1 Tax=marine sediment metagenome TaxID=412755 RepID=A0A0F9PXQ1_9ZZZZ
MKTNTIICGDCLDIMRDMPNNSVDLVLTDPPYGIGAYSDGTMGGGVLAKQSRFEATDWDFKPMSVEQQVECVRIGQNQAFFGGNYFELPPSSCWIVWNKDNGDNNFADCELIWTSFKTATRLVKWKWQGMLQEPGHSKDYRQHPTQKPLGVMLWILERYSKPDQLILDPFCGSGHNLCRGKAAWQALHRHRHKP